MKIILKDKQEIEIADCYFRYYPDNEDVDTISFVIQSPTVSIEDLKTILSTENLSIIQIVSQTKTVSKSNLRLINVTENVTDDVNYIDIYVGQ